MPRYLCRDGDSNVLPGTHEAFGFTDKKLQKLFEEVVAVRQIWLANENKVRAHVLTIHWWGNPASPGKLISDALDGLAAVNMHTVSDDGKQNWMVNVFAGKHASRADPDVVDGGSYMRSRQLMYCFQFVGEAVSRARELGRLACTEAAESGKDKITTTGWLKPRVITVPSGQIALATKRCLTNLSAADKTAAASALVRSLCPSGLTVRGLQVHKDGSVSVAVVLNSQFAARRFTVSLSELRARWQLEAAAGRPSKINGGRRGGDDSDDEPLSKKAPSAAVKKAVADDDSEDDKPLAAKAQAAKPAALDSDSDDDKPLASKLPPKKPAAKETPKQKPSAAKKPEKRKAESESESELDSEDSSSDSDSEDDKPCAERSKAPLPAQCSAADDRALEGAIKKVAPSATHPLPPSRRCQVYCDQGRDCSGSQTRARRRGAWR